MWTSNLTIDNCRSCFLFSSSTFFSFFSSALFCCCPPLLSLRAASGLSGPCWLWSQWPGQQSYANVASLVQKVRGLWHHVVYSWPWLQRHGPEKGRLSQFTTFCSEHQRRICMELSSRVPSALYETLSHFCPGRKSFHHTVTGSERTSARAAANDYFDDMTGHEHKRSSLLDSPLNSSSFPPSTGVRTWLCTCLPPSLCSLSCSSSSSWPCCWGPASVTPACCHGRCRRKPRSSRWKSVSYGNSLRKLLLISRLNEWKHETKTKTGLT